MFDFIEQSIEMSFKKFESPLIDKRNMKINEAQIKLQKMKKTIKIKKQK